MKIFVSKNIQKGSIDTLKFLKNIIDKNTLLLLSGGTSPKSLYELISNKGNFFPGAVAMIDERFGEKMHINSNEKMIRESGLEQYFKDKEIPFYQILEEGVDIDKTAENYEKILKELFKKCSKRIAIMGLGIDGHTAGIKPGLNYDHSKWVVGFDDKGMFGKRVTVTFELLKNINEFVLLVFGNNKKAVLEEIIRGVDKNVIPGGFYKASKIPTTVFTDIEIE